MFDEKTGEELWKFDSLPLRDPERDQGQGRLDRHGLVVGVNGLLFVNSGYGMFGQAPGNVMLAFKPKPGR